MNNPANIIAEWPNEPKKALSRSTRPFYWSVRRELWENRSIYIAPLSVAAVFLFGFLISAIHLPERRRVVLLLDPPHQRAAIEQPYDFVAMMLIFTAFIVGVFYCLDALYGERRDRSILFWKSLPVSDLTSVLSKAVIPLVALPAIAFAITIVTQLVMLLLSTLVLLVNGMRPATFGQLPLFQDCLVLLYGLIALSLWHAPIYGWLLLVSASVRRAAFIWAVLPWFALVAVEKITFNTAHVGSLLKYRLLNWAGAAFAFKPRGAFAIDSLSQLTPGNYLSTPGLWIGLIFAAVFLAAAVQLRRYRGPI